jgi:tetratricopeptide (TPR) repeat protein
VAALRTLTVAAAVILALWTACCSRPKQQVRESNNYINARVCAGCHAGVYEHYRQTGMARAFYAPSSASFPDARPYFHKPSGTWFQMIAKDGAWVQRSWQTGYDGKPDDTQDLKIDYVMGSGNHVRTYLHRTARNTLIELPLAWYAEKGGTWAMNPGFDLKQLPASRKIGYNCMFCHNAYPSIPPGHEDAGVEPVFSEPLPEGIDCQRCHGPGENHVRAAQAAHTRLEDVKNAIVNPARLSPARGMEVCLQCHLETTSSILPSSIRRFDRGPYSYRPGEPLSAFRLMYDHAAGAGKDDKFEIVSSAYRLRKSQCFVRSNGALTCTTCHNPHNIPHGPAAANHYNGICRQCHSLIRVKNHPQAGSCIDCHMPGRRTEDVVHAVMTDHFIQRRPARNLLAEIPEPHGKDSEYHGEVIPYGDAEDLYTAVAQVAGKSNLQAGIPRLASAVAESRPSRADFYMELGDAYTSNNQFAEAIKQYQQALGHRPGSALLLRRLAKAFRGLGQTQQALDALLRATQSEPSDPEAWYDLGPIQSDLGRNQEAIASLRKAVELDPEFAAARNSLGAALAATGQTDLAEAAFRAALRIEPTLAVAHANLANLLASRNELVEAAWHYERAGTKAVDQFNYGITLARMNRLADAQTHIEAALKDDPNLAEAHDVLGGLLESRGRVDAALVQYQEAVRIRPNFGKAHLDLGVILLNRRELAAAAAELRLASGDPDPEVREQARKALQSTVH